MEANTNHPEGCKCVACTNKNGYCAYCGNRWGKWHGFFIIRIIVAIILAIVIFWGGFMLGELHAALGGYGDYGYGGWGHGFGWSMMGENNGPMPFYYYRSVGNQVPVNNAPTTPTPTTVTK